MSVGGICVRTVDLAESNEPVHVAAQRMHARNVSTLVVLGSDKRPRLLIHGAVCVHGDIKE